MFGTVSFHLLRPSLNWTNKQQDLYVQKDLIGQQYNLDWIWTWINSWAKWDKIIRSLRRTNNDDLALYSWKCEKSVLLHESLFTQSTRTLNKCSPEFKVLSYTSVSSKLTAACSTPCAGETGYKVWQQGKPGLHSFWMFCTNEHNSKCNVLLTLVLPSCHSALLLSYWQSSWTQHPLGSSEFNKPRISTLYLKK